MHGLQSGYAGTDPVCGVACAAYSPLGRGMLTGQLKDLVGVPDTDWRKKHNPRFQGANFEKVRAVVLRQVSSVLLCNLGQCCCQPVPEAHVGFFGFLQNLALAEGVELLAKKKGCAPGQLALAWVSWVTPVELCSLTPQSMHGSLSYAANVFLLSVATCMRCHCCRALKML